MDQEVLFHIRPLFADAFACKAGECRHSCCRGWEIDIDENTLSHYRQLSGAWRERMDAAICEDKYGAHFRLTSENACPFLRSDGLCDLILAFGEDALCDICALHPRFYELIGQFELSGLGLSCEAVCELLLSENGELLYFCEETEESFPIFALLSRLGFPAENHSLSFLPVEDPARMLARLEKTEPIDEAWPLELARIRRDWAEHPVPLPIGPRYDRIFSYLLFRVLEEVPLRGLDAVLSYVRDGVSFVALHDALYGEDAEAMRRWSEQIEYSTENIPYLLSCFEA
ncbi:MAG: flagellin lysine-N-methylase [Oscillospiraceae bacterium]|nr:flagellin lysine-N-methylase [Oscillospiraceae bacterium]